MRTRALFLAVVLIGALAGAGCGRQGTTEIVARVNNHPITRSQLCDALEKADNGEAGRRALDSLIVRQLIRQEAAKRNIEVGRQEIQIRLEGLKDYVLAATGNDYETWLAETGQTEEDVTGRISLQILTGKLVLTETDRRKYFEDNKERLEALPHNNESVIYREILVSTKDQADGVREELLAKATDGKVTGKQFAEAAEEHSIDPVARRRGGMAGWLVKGKVADTKLEEALFALSPGEVSAPIPVTLPGQPGGEEAPGEPRFYRLAMVEKHITPTEITLERNADVIEEWMLSDPRYQMQLQEFFTNLRARAEVEVLSPRYQALAEAYREGKEARERRLSAPGEMPLLPLEPGEGAVPLPPQQAVPE